MAKKVGFRCEHCGHVIFVSTKYFAEEAPCPECHKAVEIPYLIYTWIPARWLRVIHLGFPLLGGYVYVSHGEILGSAGGWSIWAVLWALCLFAADTFIWYTTRVRLELVYGNYARKLSPAQQRRVAGGRRAHLAAAGGDDIMLLVPKAVYVLLLLVYWWTLRAFPVDPISFVRHPWVFLLLGIVPGVALSLWLAWTAFRISMSKRP